ncbi:MAG TPA: universal stress protein [Chloroflexota bacterium]|nr:universal stress protein [Chloroflexota bacterium]
MTSILVPYDGSPAAQEAIPYAVRLARAAGARLILTRACPDDLDLLYAAELSAQALRQRIRRCGVEVTLRVRAGEPVDIVSQELRTWQPDWMVLSSHGDSGVGRWLFGGVADALLRTAHVPTILVPPHHRTWPEGQKPRLLLPMDGSAESEHALPALRRLIAFLGARVFLLRVVEPPIPSPYAYDQCAPYVEFDPHVELERARAYLREVASGLKLGPGDAECHATVGAPGISIPTFAREHHADLVLLTLRGAGRTAATLGGTALGTLRYAAVPLVLVPVPSPVLQAEQDTAPASAVTHSPAGAAADAVAEAAAVTRPAGTR